MLSDHMHGPVNRVRSDYRKVLYEKKKLTLLQWPSALYSNWFFIRAWKAATHDEDVIIDLNSLPLACMIWNDLQVTYCLSFTSGIHSPCWKHCDVCISYLKEKTKFSLASNGLLAWLQIHLWLDHTVSTLILRKRAQVVYILLRINAPDLVLMSCSGNGVHVSSLNGSLVHNVLYIGRHSTHPNSGLLFIHLIRYIEKQNRSTPICSYIYSSKQQQN